MVIRGSFFRPDLRTPGKKKERRKRTSLLLQLDFFAICTFSLVPPGLESAFSSPFPGLFFVRDPFSRPRLLQIGISRGGIPPISQASAENEMDRGKKVKGEARGGEEAASHFHPWKKNSREGPTPNSQDSDERGGAK